jgi:hypothetical protein
MGRGRETAANSEPDSRVNLVVATDGTTRCGIGIHCTPTKKMRENEGNNGWRAYQITVAGKL